MERKQQRHGEGFNAKKLWRAALFASTGLSAVLSIPAIVRAQTAISSDTTPQGGVVVGGSASIAQAPASTTINQSSERAAINWQSFDVGANAKVQFNQPDQNAIALNRVVGGNLSQINGQINANGQIVLINQSGVVFGKGSQVNAENIVVSTSNISTQDFMAGNMAFTGAPNPGAKIINQGNITVRDTGLVGLIAPQVENDGVITARLGQVILAGASAFTLDMYGDRLISLDVTKAVQAVDVGGKLVPALVTNRGVILADGGKVYLTAQDADALVTQLIDAGGTIRADSVGAQAGTISLQGVGGDINISGNLLAKGTTGSAGGAIEALTTGTVAVASSADIDASGDAGGGVIAIGTTMLRAEQGKSDTTAPKAAAVDIAAGATLAADATGNGNGGTVALLSGKNTKFDGLISVLGGAQGGNGGSAEISSDGVISLSGTVLATAINGKPGEILLDPATLIVSSILTPNDPGSFSTTFGGYDQGATGSTVAPSALDGLSGNVTLEAGSLITIASAISMASANALSLISDGSIYTSASIQVAGSLEIDASTSLSIGGGLTAANILLTSGTAGTDIGAGVSAATGTVALGSGGTIFEGSAGSIFSSVLLSHGSIHGDASLTGGNTITTLDGFTLGGNLTLANAGGLTVGGSVSAATVTLSGASLTFESGVNTGVLSLSSTGTIFQGAGTITAGTLTGTAVGGLVSLAEAGNDIGTLGRFVLQSGGTFALNDGSSLDIDGVVSLLATGGTIALGGTNGITQTGGSFNLGGSALISLGTIGGDVSLASATNEIGTLGNFTLGGNLDLADNTALAIAGTVATPESITFATAGGLNDGGGGLIAGTLSTGGGSIGALALLSGNNTIATLGNFTAANNLILADSESLAIAGTVNLPGNFHYSGAGLSETSAGVIVAGGFDTNSNTVSGDILLGGGNTIHSIDSVGVFAGGTFALNNTASLFVDGDVDAKDVALGAPTLALAGDITIAATASAPTLGLAANEIDLAGSDTFMAGGGTMAIAPFSSGTTIDIGAVSSPNTLGLPGSIISALDTTAAAIVIGKGPVGTQAVGIDIDGSVSFGSTALVDLSTSGTIFDNSGSLVTGTLDFSTGGFTQASAAAILANLVAGTASSGNVLLGSGFNTIVSLGSVSVGSGGTVDLADSGTLTIAGAIDPAVVTLYGSMGLVIANDVSASSNVYLGSTGTVVQTAGSITTPTLSSLGSIGDDATLTSPANNIGTIDGFTLGGTLDLANAGSLTVGTVDASYITLSAGGIGFTGAVTSSNVLALASTGDITQTGGSISAPTLTSISTIAGDALFTSTTNIIGTLSNFSATGTLAVFDSILLETAGTVAAPVVSLYADGIDFGSGSSVKATTELALGGAGVIEQGSGSTIDARSLVSIGDVRGEGVALGLLGSATISTIGNFALMGEFYLHNATSADITGVISAPGQIVAFLGKGITETGTGAIDAGDFDLANDQISGDVLLAGTNAIGTIANSVPGASGIFDFNDTVPLTISGGVAGADVTIGAPTLELATGNITANGATAPQLVLASDSISIDQTNNFLVASGGTIAIAPYSASTAIDLGGASSNGTLGIPGSIISVLDTTADEIIIGKAPIGSQASAIEIDNSPSFGGTTIVDLSTYGSISQNAGSTFTAHTLEFDSAGFTQVSGATISAATLQGDGGTIDGSVLLVGANTISTLNGISLSAGTFALLDTGSLDSVGSLVAPIVTLVADTLGLNGTIGAPTLLALGSTGSITETGSISTGTLTSQGSISGDATLTGTNSIGTLGAFTLGGTLDLADASSLAVAGTVDGPYITLSAADIGFTGAVTAGNVLALASTGDIAQTGGSISAPTLTSIGAIGGDALLGSLTNSIGTLSNFSATGTLALSDSTSLITAGAVAAPVVSLYADGISVQGTVDAPTKLALGGTGSIEEAATGTIEAGSLVSIGTIGGHVYLGYFNSAATIHAIGNFSLTSDFDLTNKTSADITGLLSAPGTLVAFTGGGVTETGAGAIDAGAFDTDFNTISGDVLLTGNNSINSIDSDGAAATGTFALNNIVSLAVNGSVAASDITLAAPTIGLNNELDATRAGGTIAVATDMLTIGSGGSFVTDNGTIALAPRTPGFGIDIGGNDAGDLDITGALTTAFPVGTEEIIIGRALGSLASSIAIDSPVTFSSNILQLSASGTISDNSTLSADTLAFDAGAFFQIVGGAVDATLLRGDGFAITGPVVLNGGSNSIATLGSITTPSDLRINDTAALDVTGPVTAEDIFLTDSNAGGISVGGSLVAGSGGTIGLVSDALTGSTGTISAPNGLVSLAPFTGGNSIDLGGTGGDLNLASGFIDLIGSKVLLISTSGSGVITQDSVVSVASPTLVLAGGSIDFAGTLSVPTLLTFASTGDVSENSAATISAPALSGTASGTIGLVGGNAIGTLDALGATNNITVNNVPSIIIAGLVSTGSNNSITLDDGSNVTEIAGGGLSAGTLGGSIGGYAYLTTGNTIGELNDITVDGLLLFTNAGGGPLDLGSINTGNASFAAAGITIVGLLDIGGGAGDLKLFSTGGITEASAAGIIDAGSLYGTDSGGQVSLGSANEIASLGSFAAGANNFSLNNAIGLDIAGTVSVASGNYLALTGTSLNETGIIDAGTLVGSFSNNVSLAAANSIGTLGAFTLSAGTLTLDDTGLLNITGPVNAPSGTLVAPTMAIAGTITTTDALALESTGNVYETTGGFISTPSLTTGGGSIAGFASFGNSNSITGIGSFVAVGDLTLLDGGALTVNGPVSAATATLQAAGIAIDSGLSAGIVDLISGLGISESGGVIHTATLTGTSAESVALLDANTITTLGGFSVTSGNFGISNTSVLEIAGLVTATGTITLEGAGATEISGGTLAAAVLDSGGTALLGDVTLADSANDIGTLGGFTLAAGTLVLADSGSPSLDLTGTVAAPFATITANTIGGTGTLFGTEATLSAGSIDIGGLLSLTSDLALESSGEISESTGAIVTPTLTSGGTSITGNVTLAGAANTINTLGGFTLGGTLDLADTGLLTIDGPVAAPTSTITAGSTEVAGDVTGGVATLSAGSIDIAGSISLTTLLALESTGSISEDGGFVTVPTLTSGGTTIGGNVTLADENSIGMLGAFTIGNAGTLDLTDSGLLTIAGPVATQFATLTADTISVTGSFSGTTANFASGIGGMGVSGSISLATLLALASGGAVTESGAGVIAAGTLVSAGASINGNVLLGNTLNNIATLGGFTIGSGDTLVLDDSGALTIIGPVVATYSTFYAGTLVIGGPLSGTSQTLSGGNIDINAAVSVTNDLALETPGSVTESPGGIITAGTLTTGGTTIGGNAVLTNSNTIGTLGGVTGFTIAGTLDLADAGSPTLAIAGQVAATTSTLTANTIVSLLGSGFSGTSATFSAGSIDIGGLVSLSSQFALESTGDITESTGTIDVPLLTSGGTTIGGDVALTNDTNNIGTLGGFTLAPGGSLSLALDDNGLLTVAGPVSAPDADLSAGSISITGSISIAQTLALATDAGGIDESTGQITAATLTSGATTIQGTVALINGNAISTLSNFAATGYIILDNTPDLTIDGYVATPAELTLDEAGSITEVPGGTLAVGTLSSGSAATGNVALGNANSIVTLGGFTVGAGDTLALTDTGTLTIAGPVAAPFATITSGSINLAGTITGGTATLSADNIGIGGSISLATLLALESTGDITEPGGFVTVPTLTSGGTTIGGNTTLGSANSIASLGSFNEAGTLILTDGGSLTVTGPVNTGNATLTADGISVPGGIATGTLALYSGTNITETGGGIQAALLIGTVSSGSATLQGTNTIATLGSFTVTAGTLALTDTGLLTVAGPVVAPTATLASNTIAVTGTMSGAAATLTAGSIGISGLITTTSNLALESTGNVTETTAGIIDTPLLTSGGTTIGGNALLSGTGNGIGTLGAFAAAGTLALDDTGLLTVAGPVIAPTTTLSSGSIAINGSIDAAAALALESTGNITEPGGFITTPSLTSGGTPVGGNVALTDVNAIGTLAAFTGDGSFTLDNSGLLTVAGPVVAPVVTLSSPTIAITGAIDAATLLALESTGNVFEATNGAITTGTLTSGGIGGNATLNTALNSISTLGQFTAGGLALNDQTPLAITSPVAIAGTLALLDTGNITQTGGTISAATLTSDGGTIGGAAAIIQPGNDIPSLGAFGAVAGLALTDAVPLSLAGNIFTGSTAPLTLLDSGNPITQTGGAISTGTLNATAGNVTLGQANAIGDLGTVNAANLYVNGVGGIGGPVAVTGGATILSPAALPVSGNINAGSNLLLEALGGISQTGGTIASGPSGSATFIAGGAIILSGAISVADQLDLVAGGDILHPAGLIDAGTLAGAVGGYVTTALGTVAGSGTLTDFAYSSLTTDFDTIGNFIMHDSTFALNNDGPLAIVGSLVADIILITTNGSLTLEGSSSGSGGGIFINSGTIAPTAYFTPHPTDSVINVNNGSVFQTGTFAINTANGPPGTLFLYVDNGGIQFAPAPDELFAPFINLEISDPGGIISGNVDLDRLVILDAETRSVQLTGTLDGLQGQAAASKGIVDPFPRPEFQFNACPIGSVNCTILPIESLPPGNPLENFDLTQRKRKKLDKNVHLPGVATRDF